MRLLVRLIAIVVFVGAVGFGVYKLQGSFGSSSDSSDVTATYTVQRRTLEDRVVERGTIESQKTVYGKCEVPGRNKITFIVPEGKVVKKGDKVAAFETTEIDNDIQAKEVEVNTAKGTLNEAVQALEIQKNKNETDIATAKLEYDLAVIDLEKYREGTFVAEKADYDRAIKEAEAELEKVRDEKNNVEILVKKGYRTPQQLREIQLRELTRQFQVERDKQKLLVLEKYEKKRQLTELEAKEADNKRKWDRAKQTAEAEQKKAEAAVESAKRGVEILEKQLKEMRELREKCTLFAEQNGTVAYANERWYDPSERIREGTELWSGRNVYYLPDMTRMQVKAKVHESVVDRIKKDQKAIIRLDALGEMRLTGTVSSVAGMAASGYSSVQNYDTVILIDELPEGESIKPGMTAAVDILVGTLTDVVAVPVGAVTEHFEQSYVYLIQDGNAERRKVETGRLTHSFVEITEGLKEGEVVALDAYQRGLDDFAEAEREAGASAGPAPAAPAPGGAPG